MLSLLRRLAGMVFNTNRTNYGKLVALPYFFSAWALGTLSGVMEIIRHEHSLQTMLELAGIGIALYTTSKGLDRYYDYKQSSVNPRTEEGELPSLPG